MPLHPTRRQFLGSTLAALGLATLPRSLSADTPADAGFTTPRSKNLTNPFVYRFNIGAIEAWSISDGHMLFNKGVGLMWPPEDRDAMTADLRAHGERTDGLPLYVNVLVLRLGREIVLFDAGFGAVENANIGWLADGLASIGITPDQVTHTILSHGHGDHIGGFVRGGRIAYPNAALHVMQTELDFWRSPEPDFSKSHRTDNIPRMIENVRAAFDILEPNLQPRRDGDKILDGAIAFEAAPGHTDGHCVLRIEHSGESLLHIMDVAHHHTLMFTDPSWFIEFDHVPEVAVATRKRIFARLAETDERAYGFHLPWPGLGRVRSRPHAFDWEPERWSWGS